MMDGRVASVGAGNGGIVPPWLREPWRIVLPVEPPDDGAQLPVLPTPPANRDFRIVGNSPIFPESSMRVSARWGITAAAPPTVRSIR